MTSKLTREELLNIIETDHVQCGDAAELARMALAALDSEPVAWGNGCDKTVPAALRYLAENDRPSGGESSFNTAHLYQLAREIELMAGAPLYRHAQQPVVQPAVIPEWTNEQCLEFLSIAFRHAEIKGDLEMDDIRLGIKMVNSCRADTLRAGNSPAHSGLHPEQNSSSPAQDGNSPAQNQGWIAVSERLPDDSGPYWCWFGKERPSVIQQRVMMYDDKWKMFSDDSVTHWRPLPAAPQQEVKSD